MPKRALWSVVPNLCVAPAIASVVLTFTHPRTHMTFFTSYTTVWH